MVARASCAKVSAASYSPRCVERIDAAHAWIADRDAVIVISRARCFSSNAARAASPSAAISGPRSTFECYDRVSAQPYRRANLRGLRRRRAPQHPVGCGLTAHRTHLRPSARVGSNGPTPTARRTRRTPALRKPNNTHTMSAFVAIARMPSPPTTTNNVRKHVTPTLRGPIAGRHARPRAGSAQHSIGTTEDIEPVIEITDRVVCPLRTGSQHGRHNTTAHNAARMTRTTSVKTSRPPLLSTTVTTDVQRVVDHPQRLGAVSAR